MSRSNQNGERPKNPAVRFFEWAAKKKQFEYYDKDAPDPTDASKKGANVSVPLPFKFIVLDELHTMKGYNKRLKEGYWANEVRDIKKQPLTIRAKAGIKAQGLYEEIKGKVPGAKYYKSLYIAFFDEKKNLQIGCILLGGSAMSSWIDFAQKNKIFSGSIKVKNTKEELDEDGKAYFVPIFECSGIKEETNQKAIELDKVLQEYFKQYFSIGQSSDAPAAETAPPEVTAQQNVIDEPSAGVVTRNDFDEDF